MRWPWSGSSICSSQVWLKTELDDKKSCYQDNGKIKDKLAFSETFSYKKKRQQITHWNVWKQHAHMTHTV